MRIAIVTDEHIPYRDERAANLALKLVRQFDPDEMPAGSDGCDFYALSHFNKNPLRIKQNIQVEIDQWVKAQKEWRDAAPHAVRRYVLGNHEDRLRKYLWQHPEISYLDGLQLNKLLRLDELGIVYQDFSDAHNNMEIVYGEAFVFKHGDRIRKYSAMSAVAEMLGERFSISLGVGHTHRGGSSLFRTRYGIQQAQECFCLCSLYPEFLKYADWQQGIVFVTITAGIPHIEPIPFFDDGNNKIAFWRGKEYRE